MSRLIWIILKGNDDERFFERIVKPHLEKKYSRVKFYKYAARPRSELEKFVNLLQKAKTEYMFISDFDQSECFKGRKDQITSKSASKVDHARIVIAKSAIESWYLAGLNYGSAASLQITLHTDTENITKKEFAEIMRRGKHSSIINFKMQILKEFVINTAKQQNKSFQYFCEKFLGFAET